MRYMFRPRRAIFRQHIIKESTALSTLSIAFLRYIVIVINFDVMGCLFFLSFVLRPLSAMYNTCLLVFLGYATIVYLDVVFCTFVPHWMCGFFGYQSESHCDWRSVCLTWCRTPSGAHDQIFLLLCVSCVDLCSCSDLVWLFSRKYLSR
jgi:hypothetical protein